MEATTWRPESPPPGTNWALMGGITGIGVVLSAIVGWLVVSRRSH